MAGKHFSKEELNFLKFASIVQDEFPKALREIFTSMWNNKFARTCQRWDDSAAVRSMFQTIEGGSTKIPFNDSFQKWDCTALFQATIYAQAFALTDSKGNKKTLNAMYVKKTKLPPGSFHTSVNSPSGDQNETLALVIDQLRLLRNTFCHSAESKLNKATFDCSVKIAKNAFAAAKVNTASIDNIGNLAEEDFPTNKVTELKEYIQKELKSINNFLQEKLCVAMVDFNEHIEAMGDELKTELSDVKQELSKTTSMIKEELVRIRSDPTQMTEHEIEKEYEDTCSISGIANPSPRSYLPPLRPHFTGRSSECEDIIVKLSSESARLLNVFGSPGFGKTSTAIAAGHVLQAQGHSVYFSNFQGVKSKHDFISKILSLFLCTTTSNANVNLAPTDELCCIFREISCRVFIILDDLDDVLSCSSVGAGMTSVKDEVVQFIEEILCRCQNVRFLTTARQSLEFMSLKIEGCQSIRIEPLDQDACKSLIRKLLPSVASDVLAKVTRICGRVPLAIKLFCSLIDELNLASCLDSFFESSVCILDLLDKPDYPSDSRLKVLFESSFNRLTQPEREAFSALFMFDGYDFDMDAATVILGGDKAAARQNLTSLVRKSLVDKSAKGERFSLHPLLHSFAIEKGGLKPEEDTLLLRTMLYKHYLSLFQTLNEQFLSGAAMKAFATFYKEERFIWLSFRVGFQDEVLCAQMFDILSTAEMFLNALYLRDRDRIYLLYDLASRKVLEQGNDVSYHKIAVSRFCRNIFNLGRTDDNVGNHKKVYLLPGGMGAKCMCYQGINALSNGLTKPGVQLIENGISNLNNSPDQRFLKLLTSQLLAIYYKFSKNLRESDQFSQIALSMCQDIGDSSLFVINEFETEAREIEQGNPGDDAITSPNMPLVVWVCSLLSMWAREYLSVDMKIKLNNIVPEIQTQVLKTTRCCQNTLVSLLHIGDLALFFLNPDEPSRMYETRVNTAVEQGESSANRVDNRDDKPKEAKTDAQKLKEERLATWYFRRAQYHYFKEEYELAAQSHQSALDWRLELYGEQHMKTAESYQLRGSALSKIGEFTSAFHQFQCALNIRLQLFGEQHGKTADIRQSIGILQHKIGEHAQALESHRRALDTRLHLYGKNSAKVLKSHLFIGDAEEATKDYTSALKSYRNALEIGLELYGENHAKTAEIYLLIGNIQVNMTDYSSALQSYNCALNVKLELLRVPQVLTGYLYKTIGILQHNLGDFKSALQSKQSALKAISQLLCGEQDAKVVDIHESIARTHNSMGNYDSALDALKRVLEIKLKLYGDNIVVADCHCHIGFVQRNKGDLDAAVQSHQRELDIRLRFSGEKDPKTADSYQHIASAQNHAGNYQSAVELCQRALRIRQEVYGEQHPFVANTYRCIGTVLCNKKDFQLALYNFQQALDIRLINFGEEHVKTNESDRDVLDTKVIIAEHKSRLSCVIS